jgi:hypothetical protein
MEGAVDKGVVEEEGTSTGTSIVLPFRVVCSVNLISLQYSFLTPLGADLVFRLAGMRESGWKCSELLHNVAPVHVSEGITNACLLCRKEKKTLLLWL